jgi:hypothetical protein
MEVPWLSHWYTEILTFIICGKVVMNRTLHSLDRFLKSPCCQANKHILNIIILFGHHNFAANFKNDKTGLVKAEGL